LSSLFSSRAEERVGVITPGFIEELDDKGRLIENEYLDFGVTEQECDDMGEMCDPYEGL